MCRRKSRTAVPIERERKAALGRLVLGLRFRDLLLSVAFLREPKIGLLPGERRFGAFDLDSQKPHIELGEALALSNGFALLALELRDPPRRFKGEAHLSGVHAAPCDARLRPMQA